MTGPAAQRDAFLRACRLDVEVRKPGNVSVASPGHGMDAAMFIASSEAAAPALLEPGAPVGARVEGAVRASLATAGCNTNLGIVLLVAPMARALEALGAAASPAALRAAVGAVLATMDGDDAAAVFRAIASANPGGLGQQATADVRRPPTLGLLDAMRLAARRDRVAAQYAGGYAELFAIGLPAWSAAIERGAGLAGAMLDAFLAWLATAPDSHIARKHGDAVAHRVTDEARRWRVQADVNPEALARWDEALKARGLNPGTSADLAVATAFAAGRLADAPQAARRGCGLA